MRIAGLTTTDRVGHAVRDARHAAGLTQQQLATRAGVSRRWLIDLEAGRSQRTELGLVLATLRALGLSLTVEEPPPITNPEVLAALAYLESL
ncbi:MAG: helix-turn-helix domain-containing protein [Micrococcales bacterium]|nr:helix-turn-helix domain-containing protein [Micrococcales bacterium]